MGISSADPVSVAKVMAALVALGVPPVADPEYRPDGPTEDDLPELLGSLLAKVELEVAALAYPGATALEGIPGLLQGWQQQIGDPDVAVALVDNRLRRTAFDLRAVTGGLDEDENDPEQAGQALAARGAEGAVLAAVNLIAAHVAQDEPDKARSNLDQAEFFVATALMQLAGARMRASGR